MKKSSGLNFHLEYITVEFKVQIKSCSVSVYETNPAPFHQIGLCLNSKSSKSKQSRCNSFFQATKNTLTNIAPALTRELTSA